ncbi:hypothetical protein [Streptomyces capoamus]|uniref:hypothetical protein n=1 Tax=Streptomyces capoamus TaxID=68183 RepID=UPI0033995FF1
MTEQQPWEPGIVARYLTIGGATVDLKQDETSRGYVDDIDCTGCGYHSGWTKVEFARAEAQAHAEKCRALPRPAVNQ